MHEAVAGSWEKICMRTYSELAIHFCGQKLLSLSEEYFRIALNGLYRIRSSNSFTIGLKCNQGAGVIIDPWICFTSFFYHLKYDVGICPSKSIFDLPSNLTVSV